MCAAHEAIAHEADVEGFLFAHMRVIRISADNRKRGGLMTILKTPRRQKDSILKHDIYAYKKLPSILGIERLVG